jgi:hypothetical protein
MITDSRGCTWAVSYEVRTRENGERFSIITGLVLVSGPGVVDEITRILDSKLNPSPNATLVA